MAFIIYIRLGSGYHVVPVGRPQELRDVVRVRVRGAGGGGGGGGVLPGTWVQQDTPSHKVMQVHTT